jgi:transposase
MERHGLTEEQYRKLSPMLPGRGRRGRPPKDHRLMIDGMLWILNTGAPWRDLPSRFGPWKTVYERFRGWTKAGLWERMLAKLREDLPPAKEGEVVMLCIDGSVIRAHRSAAGAHKKAVPVNLEIMPLDAARADLAPRFTSSATIAVVTLAGD